MIHTWWQQSSDGALCCYSDTERCAAHDATLLLLLVTERGKPVGRLPLCMTHALRMERQLGNSLEEEEERHDE